MFERTVAVRNLSIASGSSYLYVVRMLVCVCVCLSLFVSGPCLLFSSLDFLLHTFAFTIFQMMTILIPFEWYYLKSQRNTLYVLYNMEYSRTCINAYIVYTLVYDENIKRKMFRIKQKHWNIEITHFPLRWSITYFNRMFLLFFFLLSFCSFSRLSFVFVAC